MIESERSRHLRAFVMDAIADDYEEPIQITADVNGWAAAEQGLTFTTEEVVTALIELVHSELANAYRLSPTRPIEVIRPLIREDMREDCYFMLTPEGIRVLSISEDAREPS